MAIRTGMTDLVAKLRQITSSSEDEFDDEALQSELDERKVPYKYLVLSPVPTKVNTSYTAYYDYYIPNVIGKWFETPIEGQINTYFDIQDTTLIHVTFGSNDNQAQYDDDLKLITLNYDSVGAGLYLSIYSYDMYGAAAEVWRIKAANRAGMIDMKTDNHSFSMDQEYKHCLDMVTYYAGKSFFGGLTRMIRVDQGTGYDSGLY